MLLVVGWSAVVVWLNVRPRSYELVAHELTGPYKEEAREPTRIYPVEYGYPWRCAFTHFWDAEESKRDLTKTSWSLKSDRRLDVVPLHLPRSEYRLNYWLLAANIAIGLLAVIILTWTSRAIVALLRAFMSKPPPEQENGD